MGILDLYSSTANITNGSRPTAKLWLNPGYDANGRFVSLPIGMPVDTMELLPIRGQNVDWIQFQTARNQLLLALQEAGEKLEPGEEVPIFLDLRLRKINENVDVSTEKNPFMRDLSQLLGN